MLPRDILTAAKPFKLSIPTRIRNEHSSEHQQPYSLLGGVFLSFVSALWTDGPWHFFARQWLLGLLGRSVWGRVPLCSLAMRHDFSGGTV